MKISGKAFGIPGRTALALSALLLLAAGCTSPGSARRFVGWEGPYAGGSYPRAVEQWTREGRIYRGLELELLGHATYKSDDFRRAFVKEYARAYQLSEDGIRALEREEAQAAQGAYEFLFAAYVPETPLNDFDQKNPSWKFYLFLGDDQAIQPEAIEKTKVDPTIRHFFPYLNPWKTFYTVRFPKTSTAQGDAPVRLRVTGVRGRIDMTWKPVSPGKGAVLP